MKNLSAFRVWAPVFLLGAACFSPLACVSATGQTAQSATQTLLARADQDELRGRLDLAAQAWEQVLLVDPNNTQALGGLARSEKATGNLAKANMYLSRLRAINPDDPGIARAERTTSTTTNKEELQEAGRLVQQGQYGKAMEIYHQLYGDAPPPGDIALAYYETEAASEEGREHAIAGLRGLVQKFPSDIRYQVALGQILTYNPKTRLEGRRILEAHPNDPEAVEALRQSLLWDAQNPATAGEIRAYLARHPDPALVDALRNERRGNYAAMTPAQRATAAVNATRSAADREAYRELNQRHLAEAELKFKAILAKTPEDANALAGMGYIRMQQANFAGAISFLVQAREDGSKDPNLSSALATSRFWYTMAQGSLALSEGDLAEADKEYQAALDARPDSPEALDGLGGTLLKAQQPDTAVAVFERYVKVQPSAPHAWRGLFLAQSGSGHAAQALDTERQFPPAVRAELASDPLYLRALASAYSSVGRDADAQRVLQAALNLPFPADAQNLKTDTKIQYAELLQQAKRFDQAAGLYRQILASDPNNIPAYQGLVQVQHLSGHDDQAILTIDAMSPELYARAMRDGGFDLTVASVYQGAGRLDVAQDILEKTLQQEAAQGAKPSVNVQIQLAGIYLQRNQPALAFRIYQQVLAQHPDSRLAWNGMLESLHTTGHDREALEQVQQMPPNIRLQLESDPSYLETVAAIYNGLGDPPEAAVFLRRVEDHYHAQHLAAPADIDIQSAWVFYAAMNDPALYRQLMELGGRPDLTDAQRRTVQTIWTDWAVRRANQEAAAGHERRAIAILNATAQAFPGNPDVLKALAGGYARAGDAKQAVAIWQSVDMKSGSVDDYRSAIGAALAASDDKDAETWLRFGLNQYPKNPELLLLAAKFEEQRGDPNRAAEYYRASLKVMPKDDAGLSLSSALSQPGPAPVLPGSPGAEQDLSRLLAPSGNPYADQPVAIPQPYLPSYTPGGAYGPPASLTNPSLNQPNAPSVPAAAPTRLRDYVPQAYAVEPLRQPGSRQSESIETHNLQEAGPLLTPAPVQHQVLVRRALQAAEARVVLTAQPSASATAMSDAEPELSQGATFRRAAFFAPLPQQTQTPTPAPTQQAQPVQAPGQTSGSDVVYGPYVPYVPPARKTPQQTGQPATQPQVAQPGTTHPLTQQPSGATPPAGANGSTVVNGVVYGPYVPYVPPAATSVQLGSSPATRQIQQPEVTDVLPTAKVSPNSKAKVPAASRPEVNAASAAAARRRAAAAAAAANSGQSKPPAEEYATPPVEPAQYTPTLPQTPVYTKPSVTPAQSSAPPGGDSYGQQYPQPRTAPAPATRPHTRAARPARAVAAAPVAPAAAAPAPASVAIVPEGPAMSYPGVSSPLSYQPYPVMGSAYPLPGAPTDQDLMDRQVPPLGGYYNGEGVSPPLTEREQAEHDLAELEGSYSGWVGGTASARYRSGVAGYDRLTDFETSLEASFTAANSVRFTVVPKAVFLNSGVLNVGNYTGIVGSPVIGTYNTAIAASNPNQQFANGIGGELQMTTRNFAAAVGYTPYEFLVNHITGRALFRPNNHFTLFFNRDAVNETQLSYAGLYDPGTASSVYSGNIWGGVVQTVGGVRFDAGNERAGFYLTADGGELTGVHVLDNTKFEASVGAYFLAHTFPGYGRLNVGASLFGEHYSNEELQLSYGLGGYFSPQDFLVASVPVTFVGRYKSNFHYTIAGAVGVQTFQEDSQLYFPLDRALESSFQSVLNCSITQLANHSCGVYLANSNTGGNYSINTEGAYRIADHWYAGGYLSANNTNNYNTVTAGFFVRYLFRPQVGTDDYPTGLFPVEGFRPLRVP